MMELEQMSSLVIRLMIGKQWAETHPLWMTQVAILTPDIDRLTQFYQEVLGIAPYRVGNYGDNLAMDAVVDLDSLSFRASWFMLDGKGKKLELMQYDQPIATPNKLHQRMPTDLGYSYSFEVQDIHKEYNRLKAAGVDFLSAPQEVENYWLVYARDIDGNVFSLRQPTNNAYSVLNF